MKDIIYKILWATIEDIVGLWEICWELNSLFPEKSKEDDQLTTKKILKYFLEQGLVTFYYNKWGSDELKEINIDDAIKMINEERYWDAPEINDICLKIGSTEKGEKFYNEELIDDFM